MAAELTVKKKGRTGLIVGTFAALALAAVGGGIVVKNQLASLLAGNQDYVGEAQKRLYVGAPKQSNGSDVDVVVRMTPFANASVFSKELKAADFDYDPAGQQSSETRWADLTKWAMEITDGSRIDQWVLAGGTLDFQSMCGSATSIRKSVTTGGGCYLVNAPEADGGLQIQYAPVVVQLSWEDIN